MQVIFVCITVSTTRILPEGAIPDSPIIFVERLFRLGSSVDNTGLAHYQVQVSQTALFRATELLNALADEYEAANTALDQDSSTL